jgi:hypothetical protein
MLLRFRIGSLLSNFTGSIACLGRVHEFAGIKRDAALWKAACDEKVI